jgi:hypothetical protein
MLAVFMAIVKRQIVPPLVILPAVSGCSGIILHFVGWPICWRKGRDRSLGLLPLLRLWHLLPGKSGRELFLYGESPTCLTWYVCLAVQYLALLGCKFGERKGFPDKICTHMKYAMLGNGISRVAGLIQDLKLRSNLASESPAGSHQ